MIDTADISFEYNESYTRKSNFVFVKTVEGRAMVLHIDVPNAAKWLFANSHNVVYWSLEEPEWDPEAQTLFSPKCYPIGKIKTEYELDKRKLKWECK